MSVLIPGNTTSTNSEAVVKEIFTEVSKDKPLEGTQDITITGSGHDSSGHDIFPVIFSYFVWQDLYLHEKPYQILLDMPEDVPESRRHNLLFADGPPEVVHDVRSSSVSHKLDINGFEYMKHSSEMAIPEDFRSHDAITSVYLPEIAVALKKSLDAVDQVYIYDWRKRISGEHPYIGKEIDFNDKVTPLGPATQPHIDQSPKSVVQRVFQYLPEQAEYLLRGRVRLVNIWQPTNGPVEEWPLATIDATTLPEEQLVECDRIRRAYLGCTQYVMYKEGFRWNYMSHQDVDDLLVFKTFDSDPKVATRCVHASFPMSDTMPNPRPRESIEVRALVFTYPKEME